MRTAPITITALSAILLVAGCTADAPEPTPSPDPTPTAEARCTPDNSEVTWGDELATAPRAPVGYRTITNDDAGTRTTREVQWNYTSTATFSIAGDPRTGDTEWTEFLEDELNDHEDSEPRFGDPPLSFDRSVVDPAELGDYVVLYDVEQFSATFSVECGGPGAGDGVLTSSRGGLGSTLAQCAAPLPEENPSRRALTEACAA